ncbi:hypothetical protein SKAU_G00175040 [Synaphobranchus kaupii]|uniref:Uncharacterized protein n=1 Tax=Synaphobranchus kaupii TaxID=118154 RepID=A0A9Q1FL57_SYNKA|nr:hypothetical protein SKAU_G00175040 [Synaphobranchus kaupii]
MYKDVKVTHTGDRSIQAFKRYIQHLIDAVHDRFPDDAMDLLNCFDVLLNPSHYPQTQGALQEYPEPAIKTIIGHFGQEKTSEEESAPATAPVIDSTNAQ